MFLFAHFLFPPSGAEGVEGYLALVSFSTEYSPRLILEQAFLSWCLQTPKVLENRIQGFVNLKEKEKNVYFFSLKTPGVRRQIVTQGTFFHFISITGTNPYHPHCSKPLRTYKTCSPFLLFILSTPAPNFYIATWIE